MAEKDRKRNDGIVITMPSIPALTEGKLHFDFERERKKKNAGELENDRNERRKDWKQRQMMERNEPVDCHINFNADRDADHDFVIFNSRPFFWV